MIDQLCSPCGMAQSALTANSTCISATDAATVCMGTCRALYDGMINNCNVTVSEYTVAKSVRT